MRIRALLNHDGGTLKTMDLGAFSEHLHAQFEAEGHEISVSVVAGGEVEAALEDATSDPGLDAILAGGGDGTVSCAAAHAWKNQMPLGVLPAGTMNLFARSIGVPLDIMESGSALARATVRDCDIATANGKPFVHQFSVGMQSRMILEREGSEHNSRFGKILASAAATLSMLSRPPQFRASISIDGEQAAAGRLSVISVSNNPFGEGHLPYADRLDQGLLGVYHARKLDSRSSTRLTADLVIGAWSGNPDFRTGTGRQVTLTFPRLKRNARAVVDGELIELEPEVHVEIHPGELKLLVPTGE